MTLCGGDLGARAKCRAYAIWRNVRKHRANRAPEDGKNEGEVSWRLTENSNPKHADGAGELRLRFGRASVALLLRFCRVSSALLSRFGRAGSTNADLGESFKSGSRQTSAVIITSTTISNNLTGLACRLRATKRKRPRNHSFPAKEPGWSQRRGAQQSLQQTQSSAED